MTTINRPRGSTLRNRTGVLGLVSLDLVFNNLVFHDLVFIDLAFIDLAFIDLAFIDLAFTDLDLSILCSSQHAFTSLEHHSED